jgi:hypothetical protein
LAGSLKVGGGASKVTVRSTLPYANVIHWGGGRGHQLGRNHGASHIKGNPFISRAAGSEMDAFAQALADALDGFFGAHGF